MPEQEASAARRAPRAARALLLIGVLQVISISLYALVARGVPTGHEALGLSVSAAYPFVLSALLQAGIAVPLVTAAAPAIALSCTVWVVALTGGLGSPFAPIFVTVPSASFSATGARGVIALGAAAILGLGVVLALETMGLLPPGPLSGEPLSRARFVLYVHCIVMFVVVGVGVEAMRASSVRKLAKARDAAEAASRAKGGFLAMMSHEIRTPLAGLLGALTLAHEESREADTRERLALATSSAETLRALLDDVLDFSRIEAGRLTLEPIPSTPRTIVGEVVSLFSSAARAKGVELGALFGEGSDLGVLVDPLRLRQVLSNLVGNSVKFTETGAIEVEVKVSPLGEDKRLVRFVVRDTGAGMTPAQLARLFQPFVQVHERGGGGGTGLGLTISRAIMEQMGGKLSMKSIAGEGTEASVEVVLPVAQAPEPSLASVVPRDTSELETLRVLVAEDAPVLRKVIEALLRREGCEVVFANDGQEAVAQAEAQTFDLILMDVHMPVLDGLEATRRIRALEGARSRVPIHALSAGAFEEQKDAAAEAGMNGYLVKPVRSPELQALLDQVRGTKESER